MQHGFIWFAHLNNFIWAARAGLVPCAAIGLYFKFNLIGILSWAIFAVCLVISAVFIAFKTPSTDDMEDFVEKYDKEFGQRQYENYRMHSGITVTKLRAFMPTKPIPFRRKFDTKFVYGDLVMFAVVRTKDGTWMVKETKSLLTAKEPVTECFEIVDPSAIATETESIDEDNMKLRIRSGGQTIEVYTYDDYHLKDFIKALTT